MKFQLKGIIRGTFSEMQSAGYAEPAVISIEGEALEDVVVGYVLPEWIYNLYVNGKRIVDPVRYLKRKGLWKMCVREVTA